MGTTADAIDEFVISTLADFTYGRPEKMGRETSLADLGVDSLALTTLATFVEAEYGCAFTPAQLTALHAAGQIGDVLQAVRQVVCRADEA